MASSEVTEVTMRCPSCGRNLSYVEEHGIVSYSCRVDESEYEYDYDYHDYDRDYYECPYCGYQSEDLSEFIYFDEDEDDEDEYEENKPVDIEHSKQILKNFSPF